MGSRWEVRRSEQGMKPPHAEVAKDSEARIHQNVQVLLSIAGDPSVTTSFLYDPRTAFFIQNGYLMNSKQMFHAG